jgi:dCMP deaminase
MVARMTEETFQRPDWDEYFMDIAHVVSKRGNCCRRKVAAVIVSDRRIISTGYNGTPRGIENCFEGGCPRCASDAPSGASLDECICAHAEENAIVQAAYHGIAVKDSSLYCILSPCLMCTKMIINAGIKEVVYETEYHFTEQSRKLFATAGVLCRQFKRT